VFVDPRAADSTQLLKETVKMRKIVLTEWLTLDGYTAGPENDMNFVAEAFDEDMGAYEGSIVETGDTLVLGRVTYESFAGAWPARAEDPRTSEPEREYARKLNAMRKIVFSKSLKSADWGDSLLLRDIDADQIRAFKQEPGKDMLIYGSASIVQQLSSLGLIDEYQLLVHPLFHGGGKKLLEDKTKLKLVSTRQFKSGVLLLTYQPRES
jgi:dihydrofolate reductase